MELLCPPQKLQLRHDPDYGLDFGRTHGLTFMDTKGIKALMWVDLSSSQVVGHLACASKKEVFAFAKKMHELLGLFLSPSCGNGS